MFDAFSEIFFCLWNFFAVGGIEKLSVLSWQLWEKFYKTFLFLEENLLWNSQLVIWYLKLDYGSFWQLLQFEKFSMFNNMGMWKLNNIQSFTGLTWNSNSDIESFIWLKVSNESAHCKQKTSQKTKKQPNNQQN